MFTFFLIVLALGAVGVLGLRLTSRSTGRSGHLRATGRRLMSRAWAFVMARRAMSSMTNPDPNARPVDLEQLSWLLFKLVVALAVRTRRSGERLVPNHVRVFLHPSYKPLVRPFMAVLHRELVQDITDDNGGLCLRLENPNLPFEVSFRFDERANVEVARGDDDQHPLLSAPPEPTRPAGPDETVSHARIEEPDLPLVAEPTEPTADPNASHSFSSHATGMHQRPETVPVDNIDEPDSRLAKMTPPSLEHPVLLRLDDRHAPPIVLTGDASTLGRGENCTIMLDIASLSREHAKIYRDADGLGWTIRDSGSLFGLYIDGRPVGQSALRNGMTVMLGPDVRFRFFCSGNHNHCTTVVAADVRL